MDQAGGILDASRYRRAAKTCRTRWGDAIGATLQAGEPPASWL